MISVERGTYLILRADGREEVVHKKVTGNNLRRDIGAKMLDFVSLGRGDLEMAVDDNGWETRAEERPYGMELIQVRPLKPINHKATEIYRALGSTGQIAGDVAIFHDHDYPE